MGKRRQKTLTIIEKYEVGHRSANDLAYAYQLLCPPAAATQPEQGLATRRANGSV